MSEFYSSPNDIKLLSDLLFPQKDDDSSNDEHVTKKSTNTYLTPADIAKKKSETPANSEQPKNQEIKQSPYAKTEEAKKKTELDYENEYMEKVDELMEESTWKATPTWDISYRQAVTASDVFLQIGNKTPATASCENMIIKVNLPGVARQSIDLKINPNDIKLDSSKYFLKMPLPQPVDPKLGNAKFDSDSDVLTITLVMDREFDFVNY